MGEKWVVAIWVIKDQDPTLTIALNVPGPDRLDQQVPGRLAGAGTLAPEQLSTRRHEATIESIGASTRWRAGSAFAIYISLTEGICS